MVESDKTSDSQETISEKKTESDVLENSGHSKILQHTPELQQKVKSMKSEFLIGKGNLKRNKALSDSDEFSSPAILHTDSNESQSPVHIF